MLSSTDISLLLCNRAQVGLYPSSSATNLLPRGASSRQSERNLATKARFFFGHRKRIPRCHTQYILPSVTVDVQDVYRVSPKQPLRNFCHLIIPPEIKPDYKFQNILAYRKAAAKRLPASLHINSSPLPGHGQAVMPGAKLENLDLPLQPHRAHMSASGPTAPREAVKLLNPHQSLAKPARSGCHDRIIIPSTVPFLPVRVRI